MHFQYKTFLKNVEKSSLCNIKKPEGRSSIPRPAIRKYATRSTLFVLKKKNGTENLTWVTQ